MKAAVFTLTMIAAATAEANLYLKMEGGYYSASEWLLQGEAQAQTNGVLDRLEYSGFGTVYPITFRFHAHRGAAQILNQSTLQSTLIESVEWGAEDNGRLVFHLADPLTVNAGDILSGHSTYDWSFTVSVGSFGYEGLPFARRWLTSDNGGPNLDLYITDRTLSDSPDWNDDGLVDYNDLELWRWHQGSMASGNDFLDWQRAYSPTPAVGAVPEPKALALIVLGVAIWFALKASEK